MSDVLTLSLRPKSLDDMIGQEKLVAEIRNQIASGRLPRTWMFHGPSRGGKTTFARILALALNKDSYDDFGALTEADWQAAGWNGKGFKNLDVIEHNASFLSGIDAIRDLVSSTNFHPMAGRYRVIILDEAQRLTKDAQNCLLKPTEDSTINIWMICTTEPDKIIEPLRLRAGTANYKMQPLDRNGVYRLLNWALPQISTPPPVLAQEFVQALYESDVTEPGVVIGALEKYLSGGSIADAVTGYVGEITLRDICQGLLKGNWSPVQAFLMKATPEELQTAKYQIIRYMWRVALGGGSQAATAAHLCVLLTENAPYDNVAHAAWMIGKITMFMGQRQQYSPVPNQDRGYATATV